MSADRSLRSPRVTSPVVLWALLVLLLGVPTQSHALSSTNVPLNSPAYLYLEKLAGFGLIHSDINGIRPFSRAEVARLLKEAEEGRDLHPEADQPLVEELLSRLRQLVAREVSLRGDPGGAPVIDCNPFLSARSRFINIQGVPRNYERRVHDAGGEGVFGIGSGLRPVNPPDFIVMQRGSEGTPLLENNDGVRAVDGGNFEFRWAAEGYIKDKMSVLIEPALVVTGEGSRLAFNRAYAKFGGGKLELEIGKDENWLGQGSRGAITLTNNAENFKLIKLSSPEPFNFRVLGYFKYEFIASRFDQTTFEGEERRPWFYALKLSAKPTDNLEVGFNLGRQVGGPGVSNGIGDTLRGIIGGTGADNSNGLAGFEARYRVPWLRNSEVYGEFSGEDTAGFWPIVESYVAGIYIPRLTDSGRDDLRFEFFQGNPILYSNGTFPGGYMYKGLPIGHSQGGGTRDYFTRYSHWFGLRNIISLDYIYTTRGEKGLVPGQAVERKNSGRIWWSLPLYGDTDLSLMYGREHVANFNLVPGTEQNNQVFMLELKYRY